MEPARDRHPPARQSVFASVHWDALDANEKGGPDTWTSYQLLGTPGGVAVALVHESLLTCPGRENRLARLGVATAIARNRTENCKIVRLHRARPAVRLENRLHSVA